jgi:hypothetical protein
MTTSEIIICARCHTEIDLNYGDKWEINDLSITSQTKCKCTIQKQSPTILDKALKDINEINLRSSSKIPNTDEGSSKG